MAYINNYHIFVESEDVSRGIEMTSHPVETGLDITDNVKRSPITISISGEIVGENASTILDNITALHQGGKYVRYSGRNIISNAIITKFDTGHPNTIFGGCSFSMEIKEVRVAESAFINPNASAVVTKKTTKSGTQQVQSNTEKKYHVTKKGDTLWKIAEAYYGSGIQYYKIYEANSDIIKDPNIIAADLKLLIP